MSCAVNSFGQTSGNLTSKLRRVAGQCRAVQPGFNAHQAADVPAEEAGDGTAHFRSDPQRAPALLLHHAPQEVFECCLCFLARGAISRPWLALHGGWRAAHGALRRLPLHGLLRRTISRLLEAIPWLAYFGLSAP